MKIIIEIKDNATFGRIAELDKVLNRLGDGNIRTDKFHDVIAFIKREL